MRVRSVAMLVAAVSSCWHRWLQPGGNRAARWNGGCTHAAGCWRVRATGTVEQQQYGGVACRTGWRVGVGIAAGPQRASAAVAVGAALAPVVVVGVDRAVAWELGGCDRSACPVRPDSPLPWLGPLAGGANVVPDAVDGVLTGVLGRCGAVLREEGADAEVVAALLFL